MNLFPCPICDSTEILTQTGHCECLVCGHEWEISTAQDLANEPVGDRVVKDAYGNVLSDGDVIAMIKDLKLKGTSQTLKVGTKSKPIRLQEGDHEISCKMDGLQIALKACFVKKVPM